MGETVNLTLEAHPDIELGRERRPLEAFLTFPEAGINEDTGIFLLIDGLGGRANSQYQSDELRPFVADTFNCVAIGVNYFGIARNEVLNITPEFLYNFNRIYGLNLSLESFKLVQSEDDIYRVIAEAVIGRGITSVDVRCQPTLETGRGEYQSWGFLPAIDCLQVVGEVLKTYPLNPGRIMAYGSGYGGYIALLLGKFAPHTFSVIMERGAYCRSELKHIACGEVMEADYIYSFAIRFSDLRFTIAAGSKNPWTIEDELSPAYFSDSHRRIRSLLAEGPRMVSPTRYYILHAEDDDIVPVADKDRLVDSLRNYAPVYYQRLPGQGRGALDDNGDREENGEKELFTLPDLSKASDRELLQCLSQVEQDAADSQNRDTDFSMNSRYVFDCGEKLYEFSFADSCDLQVSLRDKP